MRAVTSAVRLPRSRGLLQVVFRHLADGRRAVIRTRYAHAVRPGQADDEHAIAQEPVQHVQQRELGAGMAPPQLVVNVAPTLPART